MEGETSDFDSDFDSENQFSRTLTKEHAYIKLKIKCKYLLKQLSTNKYEHIKKTLLKNKRKYQNKHDTKSQQIYRLIRNLIDMHVNLTNSLDDMKNIVRLKIKSYDSLMSEINKAKNYSVDINAFNDVTGTHSSIYNIDTSTRTLQIL